MLYSYLLYGIMVMNIHKNTINRKLEIYGCCLHPLSYGAYGWQDVSKRPLAESIKLIWHTLITTLRAQYERIDGTDDASELMRLNFSKSWGTTSMAVANEMDI